ncbi:MAG TPA: c-type cytochrome [Candidatus Acidoferrales bacterium]|jgi:mono/diheme cytochrome c family protein|nr:c-type cytochrome [Candidatus Acidoferrales bacterium]
MIRCWGRIQWAALPLALCLLGFSAPLWGQGEGATLFKSKCAGCHSADGSASGAAGKAMHIRNLASPDVQKQTDAELTAIITNGKGSMPAYKDKLSADQIKQAVSYIRELAKKK